MALMRAPKEKRDVAPIFWDVAVRDRGKCVYCELDGSRDVRILMNLHLDHLIPRGRKVDGIGNLVLACSCCNGDKGSWDPSEGIDDLPRETLIEAARRYIAEQRRPPYFYAALYEELNSK